VVEALRRAIPGITFSTDIIVGFPGETEAQFEETLSLVSEARFDDAYTFKYSPRDGTPATRMKESLDDDAASERLARLIAAVRNQARIRNLGRIGTTHEVLVERPARRGGMLGRTRTNALVLLPLTEADVGRYLTVRLSGSTGSTFTGTIVHERGLAVL
jgi:tRNA-2-methylthio-N6-dimethylallyladenosine synthase